MPPRRTHRGRVSGSGVRIEREIDEI